MKANPVFSLYIPTKLVFGCGEIKKLSSEKLPGKKALVVISSGTSMRKYGYLERVLAQLRLNNVETLVYDKILPNPIKEHVMEAAAICREEKCDFVVGLGGGSSIDSAKSIAVMACNDGDYWDYVSGGSGKWTSCYQSTSHYRHPYYRRNRNRNGSMDSDYPRNGSRKDRLRLSADFPYLIYC